MFLFVSLQQFGKILDVEIIFNERGSKVSPVSASHAAPLGLVSLEQGTELGPTLHKSTKCPPWVRVSRKRLLTLREIREE